MSPISGSGMHRTRTTGATRRCASTGPVVRLLEAGFYENFVETAGRRRAGARPLRVAASSQDGAHCVVRSSPTGGSNDLKRLYLLAIAAARRTLDITSPYFVIDESSDWALAQDAVRAACVMRILVEGDITDAQAGEVRVARRLRRTCSTLGIGIYEYQPTMMHTKAMVIDGVWSMFGSANFDNRSLELNDEMNVAVFEPRTRGAFLSGSRGGSAARRSGWCWRSGGGAPLLEKIARACSGAISGRCSNAGSFQLPAPRSQLPAPSSRSPLPAQPQLPAPRSQLPAPRSQLPAPRFQLPASSWKLREPRRPRPADWTAHRAPRIRPRPGAPTRIMRWFASVSRRLRPATCTSAEPARRSSTGCLPAGRAGLRPAHRGHRYRAIVVGDGRRDRARGCAGWGSTGTKVPMSADRTRPYFQSQRLAVIASSRDRLVDGRARLLLLLHAGPRSRPSAPRPKLPAVAGSTIARAAALAAGRDCRGARRRAAAARGALQGAAPGRPHFEDLVHGPIAFENANIEDFVILRSDGQPTYHLSVVVDDIDMAITHVVRGDDHISNTPKQVLLYKAFGAPPPKFAHVPLILGPDKKRLSKRHGATSVMEYPRLGYLPEAMVNFLALLGWSPGATSEIFDATGSMQRFTLEGISGGNAVFNPEKLDWFNQQHICALPSAELARADRAAAPGRRPVDGYL